MRTSRSCEGHALSETLVVSLVLVPLLVLTAWIGKLQSMREATIAASRMLAFECTVRIADCSVDAAAARLADELRMREFSRTDAPIRSAVALGDEPSSSERNPLWVDRGGRSMLENFSDVGVRVSSETFDAAASLTRSQAGAGSGAARALLDAGPHRFGLSIEGGLLSARVQANVSTRRDASAPSNLIESLPLRIQGRTVILADAWTASGPEGAGPRSVRARLVPGRSLPSAYEASLDARYAPTRGFISLMQSVGLEPSASGFRYHDADMDVVPPDRLPESALSASDVAAGGGASQGIVTP